MDIVDQLRTLAKEAAIRSVPKLLQTAKSEGLVATKKQADEALAQRVPAQVLHPPPRSTGKAFSEGPESRYAIDLVDFSQNTSRPGYVLLMMQTWSRRIWATPMKDKTSEQTNLAMKVLLEEAKPKADQPHTMLHDAGQEFSRISTILPPNWVSTVKDPLDRQGIATLDKGMQELKKNMEDIIEERGGTWRDHLQAAVSAYNRRYNSAVLGPPSKIEDGSFREFLNDQTMADNMEHNAKLASKRIADVQKTGHFREATGAKRGFNQQFGPKLAVSEIMPGGGYVKGSDGNLHLLKRIIPVHADSGEPKGRLTQPRQYLHESLEDLAEDIHAELKGHPQTLADLAQTLDPKLAGKGVKIKTKAFIVKYSDLFKIQGEMVHALVISQPKRSRAPPVVVHAIEDVRPSQQDPAPSPAVARPKRSADFFRGLGGTYERYPLR